MSELVIGITDKNGDSFGKPQPRRTVRNCTLDFTQSKSELQMSSYERVERLLAMKGLRLQMPFFFFGYFL